MQLFLLLLALLAGLFGALSGNLAGLGLTALCVFLMASGLAGRATTEDEDHLVRSIGELVIKPWALAAAVALGATGVAVFLAQRDPFDRWSGYFWLLGLLTIFVAGWLYDRSSEGTGSRFLAPRPGWDWLDWLSMGLLTAGALALRLYRLNDFLPAMSGDEGEMGLLALHALWGTGGVDSPQPLPFFSTAFLDHPTLFHYLQAGAMWLFGETLAGLRILSAIVGAFCISLLYGVARLGWGRAAALTAGWLMAISHLPIHYSRIALNNIESVWFMIALVLLFFLVYRDQRIEEPDAAGAPRVLSYVLIGLVLGLSQYFYYGSRLLPIVAATALFYLWRIRRIALAPFLMMVIAGVVAFAPLASHYSDHTAGFLNRVRGVSVFTPDGLVHTLGPDARWPADIPRLFWIQFTRTVGFFVDSGDRSAFYLADLPVFDPVTVLLFWAGLGLAVARVRRFHEWVILTWLGLGTVLAGVLTTDAPNGPRLLLIVPAVYLLAGLLVQKVFDMTRRPGLETTCRGAIWVGVGIAVSLGVLHFRTYFVTYADHAARSVPINIAHEMVAAGDGYRSYLFGAPNLFADYGVMRFVARDTERHDAVELADLPPPDANDGKGLLIITLHHRMDALEQAERRYPGGVRQVHRNDEGEPLYATYRVEPGVVADRAMGSITR